MIIEQVCESIWDFFFSDGGDNEPLILSSEEKMLIVNQITEVKSRLSNAQDDLRNERFDEATQDVVDAIEASTCSRCKKKMTLTAHDIVHAKGICELGGANCNDLKQDINASMEEFKEEYLPRVEEVLSAREQ